MSPASSSSREPRAVIFGASGTALTGDEKKFFRSADPLGFILFARNCENPAQVRTLVAELRATVRREDAPVLIDQEGGRVVRLKPPHWRAYPPASSIAASKNPAEAAFLGARLMADDLADLDITVDCAPVLDLPVPGADGVIGDRAYGAEPAAVARLGRAVCDGLLDGGVLPVIKHIPGHGRARVDSHHALPVVDADAALLEATDFAPFRALSDMPWAMTAHVVYSAIDDTRPATSSRTVIDDVIRGAIGFDGMLVSDDIGMGALAGTIGERVAAALEAGCDAALHCSGRLAEMHEAAEAASRVTPVAAARVARGEALRRASWRAFDREEAEMRFDRLVGAPMGARAE
jgi:beta-N-acetylhexosaminidase